MKSWVYMIIENMFYSPTFKDEEFENMSDEEINDKIQKVCDLVIADGDLENEIDNLISESAEWYYYHCVKNGEETN